MMKKPKSIEINKEDLWEKWLMACLVVTICFIIAIKM